ncbi:transferrin-like [Bacillus rossius redtenbacheri]|uniref:transferrin-like n=1 Tax=Bacillus rossius redtenbacheri TaxID=93214 RepID=UPI002FDE716B
MKCAALWTAALCALAVGGVVAQTQYRMCVDKYQGGRDCVVLESGESSVRCVEVTDSVDCAQKIQSGRADFGVFTAEEALLASKFVNSDTQVLLELVSGGQQAPDTTAAQFKFESVALVRANHSGGLAGLRGKNYCHPGFQRTQYWTDRVLKEFELRVANTQCGGLANLTTVENELRALSGFFNSSCRPGTWVLDDWTQDTYRRQFPQMCSLCDRPDTCSYKPGLASNHYGALDCLLRGGGDVAYVEAASVRSYFGVAGNDDMVYLCKDGSTQPLSTASPCAWVQQRWDSIVSSNRVAAALRPQLVSWLPAAASPRRLDWTSNLASLVLPDSSHYAREVAGTITMQQYIMEGRDIPVTSACQRTLRWCTVSELEDSKCEWLRQAGVTHGLSPELLCLRGSSKFDCLRRVEADLADLVGIDTDLGYLAKNVYNLNTASYQESTAAGNNAVVAVVKADSSLSGVKGLVNSKACFPQFGGIAWVAFFESLRNASLLRDGVCPYGPGARRVFAEVCAPGARSASHDRQQLNNNTDLCGLCSAALARLPAPYANWTNTSGCAGNSSSALFGDRGALLCLSSGAADVAFVRARQLPAAIAELNLAVDSYRILCRDGSKRPLTETVPDNCPLATVVGGEIVARRNRSKVMTRDINNLMSEFDDWFGYAYRNYENIFHIFESFMDTDGVLLQNNTIALLTSFNTQSYFVSAYDDMKRTAYTCRSAATPAPTAAGALLVLALAAAARLW